jgi:hypothetical protein
VRQRECSNCRFRLTPEDAFCGNCGTRTETESHYATAMRPSPQAPPEPAAEAPLQVSYPASPEPAAEAPHQVSYPAPPEPAAEAPLQAPYPASPQAPPPAPPQMPPQPPAQAHPQVPPWATARHAVRPRPPMPGAALSGRFFSHAQARPAGRVTNTTRYLSAAAYLNPRYANVVIGDLVASHRAVVPSVGIDLGVIIRHCLNARGIQLVRDVLLTVLLVISLILATVPTIIIVIIASFLGFLPGVEWERKSFGVKLLAGAAVAAALFFIGFLWLIISLFSQQERLGLLPKGPAIVTVVAFLALTAVTQMLYTYNKYRALCDKLGPDADPAPLPRLDGRVESRIAEVAAAQSGNLTLYSGENPFIGTGQRERVWSIAIELSRAPETGRQPWVRPRSRGYVPIDPVELHKVIRERLLRLRDPGLPENERLSALVVEDHVVGEGERRWDEPLVDPDRKVPYSMMSPEAIEALIRHPQAGLRYYQRASVSDEGQAVWSGDQEVIGRADQEIAASAFVYVAVEGGMFYLEFVSTVLPPIYRGYHLVDLLPKISSGRFTAKVSLDAASTVFRDLISAPFRACGTLLQMWHDQRSFAKEAASVDDVLFGDIGARISVRELGAARAPHTYIQRLDAAKYTKLVERLITDTVLDFLEDKGVDTTAYRASASSIINNGNMISGGYFAGPVAGGMAARAEVSVQAAQPTTTAD